MHVVVMAGGGGTRLRPISTPARPKPFLPLLPDGETLLQRTVARLAGPELGLGAGDIAVVASAAYAPIVRDQVPGVGVVVEPEGRNTAAAIALALLALDRPDDETMVVLPADHRIDPTREARFRSVLAIAAGPLAAGALGVADPLVTLGIAPTWPSPEYGYLVPRAGGGEVDGVPAHPLAAFREKPGPAEAAALLALPGVAWNAGMFAWRRGVLRAALERHDPGLLRAIAAGLATDDLAGAYARLPGRSIDHALMEPAGAAGGVVMAGLDVGWSDVGTWPALLAVLGAPGIAGRVVEAGERVATGSSDLVVERTGGLLAVGAPAGGTIVPARPVALLEGARAARPIVEALIARCAAAETDA